MTVTSIRVTHLQELARSSEAAHGLAPPGTFVKEGHNQVAFGLARPPIPGNLVKRHEGLEKLEVRQKIVD